MVLGWTLATQFAALLAISGTGSALTVPEKRHTGSRKNSRDLTATTEGLPEGVIHQPLQKVQLNTTKAQVNARRSQSLSKRGDIVIPGTQQDVISIANFGYLAQLELFDGNGGSLGNSLVAVDTASSDLWTNTPATAESSGSLETIFMGSFNPQADTTGSSKLVNDIKYTLIYEDGTNTTFQFWSGTVGFVNGTTPLKNFQFGSCLDNSAGGGVFGIGPAAGEGPPRTGSVAYANYPVALKEQGLIKKTAFSIYFGEGPSTPSSTSAHILWGGIDHSLYTGDLVALPNESPYFPAVHVNTITTSDGVVHQVNNTATLDSGTTTGILPDSVVDQIEAAFGYTNGAATKYPTEGSFTVDFGATTLVVPYTNFYYTTDGVTHFQDFDRASSYGNVTILGDTILSAAYMVYDYEANTSSIAAANHSPSSPQITVIE